MSLIQLRQRVQRQGKRAAIVFVVLSLALLAAHHAGVHASHEGGAEPHAAMSTEHGVAPAPAPVAPDTDGIDVAAICLAVLPMVLLLALAAVAGIRLRGWWLVATTPAGKQPFRIALLMRPPRDGPRDLCVMRC